MTLIVSMTIAFGERAEGEELADNDDEDDGGSRSSRFRSRFLRSEDDDEAALIEDYGESGDGNYSTNSR